MTDSEIRAVAKTTPDLLAEQVEKLKQLFPECVSEGQVDGSRLLATLGQIDALTGSDAYTFTWAGKAEAFRAIQTPSAASLQPAPGESVNWETTRHLFIEGENLEVLKLLYKSYVGKVKMIYIDPPYNTGNDFIYKDDYREPVRAYLEKTGQVDAEGNVLTSNPETRGRYHSDWLSMMYPRLFLARQLLREDGVIFVSIDDNEVHHLRLLMNEVFGEENFVANIIWEKYFSVKNTARQFSTTHEYVLIYARNSENWEPMLLPRTEEADARYSNPDDDSRGPWTSGPLQARNYYSKGKYEVISPTGKAFAPPTGTYWRVSQENYEELAKDNRIWWGEDGQNVPRIKRFLSEVRQGMVPSTLWSYEDAGHTQNAKEELLSLVEFAHAENVLITLKPTRLLQRMLQVGTDSQASDIVLDFFSGSASMAHAVLVQNREDGGNRQFVMVQYPEALPIPEPNLTTIADIGKTRIRHAIERMQAIETIEEADSPQLVLDLAGDDNEAGPATPQDLGFKVFKLAPSTFRRWAPPTSDDAAALAQQLAFFDDGLTDDADPLHVIYEVLLKEGYSLNAAVEAMTVGAPQTAQNTVYRITDEVRPTPGAGEGVALAGPPPSFYLCLDDVIATDALDALGLDDETVFVCQDAALDDSQKVNLSLQCVLKTV